MKHFLSLITLATAGLAHGQVAIDRYLSDALTYTNIVTSADQVSDPRDLDFKPFTNELWVVNKGASDGGSMVIVHNAGLPGQAAEYRKDTHSSHFMRMPSALAFSDNGEWSAVSEIQNTNTSSPTFMGPALWLGDLNIFATVFQNDWLSGYPLGSHIDMLHQSPYAMGIAADSAKVFWVMDGYNGNICRYDFVQDHGPGYDNHSAGKIWRYIDVPVTRVPDVPSHMVLDKIGGWLYFIDGGNKQVKRMNVNSGTITGNLTVPGTANETLGSYKKVEGAVVEIVDTWTTQPCGIDYTMGRLIVSDHDNGDIRIYDVTGTPALLGTIPTGQAGIMGVKVGPDGRIWFVNNTGNTTVRIDPTPLANDAAITAIVSPANATATVNFYSTDNTICSGSVLPTVTLTNAGSNDLTQVTIDVDVDGSVQPSYSWAGTLAPGASTNVDLPVAAVLSGAHVISAHTSGPNGTYDPNELNDRMEGAFRVIDPIQNLPFNEGFAATTFPPDGWNYVHFNPNNKMTRATVGGFGNTAGSMKMDHYSGSMDITGQLDYLLMPRVDLYAATPGTTLEFSVAYAQYNTASTDRFMVKASTDCGANWNTIYDKQGSTLSTTGVNTSTFTPTSAQWRTEHVDLGLVLGQPDVQFMFVTESNFGNNMYMDDVGIGNTIGIQESAALNFSIYPNPASDRVDVMLGTLKGPATVELYDAVGALVRSERVNAVNGMLHSDLRTVAKGVYTLTVRTETAVGSKALIVLGR